MINFDGYIEYCDINVNMNSLVFKNTITFLYFAWAYHTGPLRSQY